MPLVDMEKFAEEHIARGYWRRTLADLNKTFPVNANENARGEYELQASLDSNVEHKRHHRDLCGGEEGSESESEESEATAELAESTHRPFAIYPRFQISVRGTRERKVKDRSKDPLIYLLFNLVNGHGYVGKAVDSHLRMWEHETGKGMRGKRTGKMQLVDKKIQQYGWHNFAVIWLETNVSRDRLLEREAFWMTLLGTMVGMNGYNVLQPGVEVISMSDPEIRKRWEAANPEGVRKATATKRAKREKKLAEMDPKVADALRDRLDKEAARNGKRHRGEEMPPDGRFGRNDKRRATFAAKREAKMALMTPEEAEKYRKTSEAKRKSDEKNRAARLEYNRSAKHKQWMKEYRERTKGSRVRLG